MGDEVLEESEFDPMFTDVEKALSGKRSPCSVPMAGVTASGCGTGRTGAGQPVPNWSQTA